jgi:hypothetical protein
MKILHRLALESPNRKVMPKPGGRHGREYLQFSVFSSQNIPAKFSKLAQPTSAIRIEIHNFHAYFDTIKSFAKGNFMSTPPSEFAFFILASCGTA